MSGDWYLKGYSSQSTQNLFSNISPSLLAHLAPDTLSCSYPCLGLYSLNSRPTLWGLITFRTQTFTKVAGVPLPPEHPPLQFPKLEALCQGNSELVQSLTHTITITQEKPGHCQKAALSPLTSYVLPCYSLTFCEFVSIWPVSICQFLSNALV